MCRGLEPHSFVLEKKPAVFLAGGVTVLVSVGCAGNSSDGYGVADRSPDDCYRCVGCVGGAGAWVMPLAASDARPRP